MSNVQPEWIDDGNLNRWRYHIGSNNELIDIDLTQEQYAICMFKHFDRIQQQKWFAISTKCKYHTIWYAASNATNAETGKRFQLRLHVWLHPNIASPIDHIDGNGLNNVESNVRSGSHGVNARNKRNAVGVRKERYGFSAHWRESDGTKKQKYFANSTYEDARSAALAYRKENAARALNDVLIIQSTDRLPPPIVPIVTIKRARAPIQIGVKGLTFNKNRNSIDGRVTVNKRVFRKNFPLSKYGGSIDNATEAGIAWANIICTENPCINTKKRQKVDDDE